MKIKGRLFYMGWFNRPWNLLVKDGTKVDLWPIVDKFLESLNGQFSDHKQGADSYILRFDKKSDFKLEYLRDELIILKRDGGFGFSNVHAYLDTALVWLSGRMINIEIEDKKRIKFFADKSEKVLSLCLSGNSSSYMIPEGVEKTICKIGQPDCCIFPAISPEGFECRKFSGPIARDLLDRLAKGTIRASRIGNCEIGKRKKENTKIVPV